VAARKVIAKSGDYQYGLRVNKRDMRDYQRLCNDLGTSAPADIHNYIMATLVKYGKRDGTKPTIILDELFVPDRH